MPAARIRQSAPLDSKLAHDTNRERRQPWRRFLIVLQSVCLVLAIAIPELNAQEADLEEAFAEWLVDHIRPRAEAAGVSAQTFARAFRGVTLDLDLPELVLPSAEAEPAIDQAEFRSPALYFDEQRLATLAAIGISERNKWASILAAIEARYGVPGEIVLAIWARESSFGRAAIPHYAIEALATEAFLGRRASKFEAELIAALQILEAGDVTPDAMRSSWAGGLGLPQFLPSTFLAYAVDFDGDGRRDIWGSVPDALASIASYLEQHGWNTSLGWGAEIAESTALSCLREGPHQGLPAAGWHLLGLATTNDAVGQEHFLLLPAGNLGPGFLVTDNFYVLKEYNRSDLYALYVGHLGDRISGDSLPFSGEWLPLGDLTHGEILEIQLWLEAGGYDVGGADGLIGFRTRIAVGAAQSSLGLPETCLPDRALLEAIR